MRACGVIAAAFLAAPAAAQPSLPPPDMTLLAAAGVDFPTRLGGLERVQIEAIGPDPRLAGPRWSSWSAGRSCRGVTSAAPGEAGWAEVQSLIDAFGWGGGP